jgi:hypothetical protein
MIKSTVIAAGKTQPSFHAFSVPTVNPAQVVDKSASN